MEELVEIKTNFFVGNYQSVINDGDGSPNAEKRLYAFRSQIALHNYSYVLDEVDNSSPVELQVAKLLALYLSGEDVNKAKSGLADFLKKPTPSDLAAQFLLIAAATLHFQEGDLDEALRCAAKSTWLEGKAIMTQIYLQMNRFDLAEKESKLMQQIDDDSVLTQLSQAWVLASLGQDRANQASYIFEELIEKYGATSLLLNGQAACKMACNQFAEAEPLLLQALEKSPNDRNTILILAVCARYLNKPADGITRKIKQARSLPGQHPWLSEHDHHEQLFDSAAARYQATKL